jgi:hypothetical protein
MPQPAYIKFILKSGEMSGPNKVEDVENLWSVLQFEHGIFNSNGASGWRGDFNRWFKPVSVWLENGKFMTELYRQMVRGDDLERVELYWIGPLRKMSRPGVYMKNFLYPVKIASFRFEMPNVKQVGFERYPHLVRLELWYRFMEVLYVPGHHLVKIEWMDFLGLKDPQLQKMLEGMVLDEGPSREQKMESIVLTPGWEHADEKRKKELQAYKGDRVCLIADVEGVAEGRKITFAVYIHPDRKDGIQCLTELSGTVSNKSAQAEWVIDLSKVKTKETYTVQFDASDGNKYSAKCKIPIAKRVSFLFSA